MRIPKNPKSQLSDFILQFLKSYQIKLAYFTKYKIYFDSISSNLSSTKIIIFCYSKIV